MQHDAGRLKVWADEPFEDAGPALVALGLAHKDQFSGRKQRAVSLLSHYEGRSLSRFAADSYDTAEPLSFDDDDLESDSTCPLIWNVGASIIDTIDAKLFAMERKKTAFVVTEGGWDVQRAAVLGARFVEGQMNEPQGIFPDAWQLWRHAARLAVTATGAAAVFFWTDPSEGKIVLELDDTLSMWVDTTGLPYDGVASLGRLTWWDPARLAAKYTEHAAAIYSAAERPDSVLQELWSLDNDRSQDEVRRVAVFQGWTMARAKGRKGKSVEMLPGKHCVAIQGQALELSDYEHTDPPCVFFIPQRHLAGNWGRTVLERIVRPAQRVNEILSAIDDAERRTPKNVVIRNPAYTTNEQLGNPENTMIVDYSGPPGGEPKWIPAPLVSSQHFELLDRHLKACFDLPGMSEAHVASTREKGLSSGVAIRLVQNQVYERFAPIEDEFTRCSGPASARQIIRCARQLQQHGGFSSVWRGNEEGGFLREIDASVFETLDSSGAYRVEAEGVSGSVNTPADRVQMAEELMQAGIITGEAYASILQHYDTYGETGTGLARAEKMFVARQIDSWLYDEVDEAEDRYMGPEQWMHQQTLLLEVGAKFIEAKMLMHGDRNNPEVIRRLQLFHRFMAECESQLRAKAAAGAPAAPGKSGGAAIPVTGPGPGGVPAAPGVVGAGPGALAAPGTAPPGGPGGPLAA